MTMREVRRRIGRRRPPLSSPKRLKKRRGTVGGKRKGRRGTESKGERPPTPNTESHWPFHRGGQGAIQGVFCSAVFRS